MRPDWETRGYVLVNTVVVTMHAAQLSQFAGIKKHLSFFNATTIATAM